MFYYVVRNLQISGAFGAFGATTSRPRRRPAFGRFHATASLAALRGAACGGSRRNDRAKRGAACGGAWSSLRSFAAPKALHFWVVYKVRPLASAAFAPLRGTSPKGRFAALSLRTRRFARLAPKGASLRFAVSRRNTRGVCAAARRSVAPEVPLRCREEPTERRRRPSFAAEMRPRIQE